MKKAIPYNTLQIVLRHAESFDSHHRREKALFNGQSGKPPIQQTPDSVTLNTESTDANNERKAIF